MASVSGRLIGAVLAVGMIGLGACEAPGDGSSSADQSASSEQTEAPVTWRQQLSDVSIHGHRGARGLRPEHTLPGFERALDLGVDTLELDLHLSSDDRLIVWHEPFVRETKCRIPEDAPRELALTTESERASEARVRSLSADALAAYDCARNPKPERFTEQTNAPTELAGGDFGIVTLTRLLAFVDAYADSDQKTEAQRANAETVGFNIELKRHPKHPEFIDDGYDGDTPGLMERRLVDLIRQHGLVDRATIQSFDHRALIAVHAIDDDLRLSALESYRVAAFPELAEQSIAVWSPDAGLVDETTLREARDVGLTVLPWTVNAPDEMQRLVELGVDGLITDRPDLLVSSQHRD